MSYHHHETALLCKMLQSTELRTTNHFFFLSPTDWQADSTLFTQRLASFYSLARSKMAKEFPLCLDVGWFCFSKLHSREASALGVEIMPDRKVTIVYPHFFSNPCICVIAVKGFTFICYKFHNTLPKIITKIVCCIEEDLNKKKYLVYLPI